MNQSKRDIAAEFNMQTSGKQQAIKRKLKRSSNFCRQAINDLKNTFERKPRISKRVNRNKYNGRFRRMRDEVTLVDRPIVGSRNKRQMLTKEVAEFA
ncbi:hypothetical protein OUZ56_001360 [Daphnia magna]|uniref:Uncharacterized protein n=1 Tax=Daphnia magna TaxID=35525 RepID=A0ABR0A2E8_9CRUS|nr:hypothetical protein OUZ56_001360 [Daphnia magna]